MIDFPINGAVVWFICFNCYHIETSCCRNKKQFEKFVKNKTLRKLCKKCKSKNYIFRDGYYNQLKYE